MPPARRHPLVSHERREEIATEQRVVNVTAHADLEIDYFGRLGSMIEWERLHPCNLIARCQLPFRESNATLANGYSVW